MCTYRSARLESIPSSCSLMTSIKSTNNSVTLGNKTLFFLTDSVFQCCGFLFKETKKKKKGKQLFISFGIKWLAFTLNTNTVVQLYQWGLFCEGLTPLCFWFALTIGGWGYISLCFISGYVKVRERMVCVCVCTIVWIYLWGPKHLMLLHCLGPTVPHRDKIPVPMSLKAFWLSKRGFNVRVTVRCYSE